MINATIDLMTGPVDATIYSNTDIPVRQFWQYTAIHSEDEGQPTVMGNADSAQEAVDELLAFGLHP